MKCAQFFSTPNRCRVTALLVWAKPPKLFFSLNTFNYIIIIIIFNLLPLLEICAPISPRVFDVQTQNLAKILDRHQEEVLWFLQQIRPTDFEECGVKGPIFPSQLILFTSPKQIPWSTPSRPVNHRLQTRGDRK